MVKLYGAKGDKKMTEEEEIIKCQLSKTEMALKNFLEKDEDGKVKKEFIRKLINSLFSKITHKGKNLGLVINCSENVIYIWKSDNDIWIEFEHEGDKIQSTLSSLKTTNRLLEWTQVDHIYECLISEFSNISVYDYDVT